MSDPVSSILLRFPGPVVFSASRKKWAGILLVCVGFVAVGTSLLYVERFQTFYHKSIFWSGIVFFGLGVPLAVAAMLPGASKLALDAHGFEITTLFRRRRFFWRDATSFHVFFPDGIKSAGMVMFDNAKQKDTRSVKLNVSLTGRNSGIPDTYGFAPEELVHLMTQWRERALK